MLIAAEVYRQLRYLYKRGRMQINPEATEKFKYPYNDVQNLMKFYLKVFFLTCISESSTSKRVKVLEPVAADNSQSLVYILF